MSSDYITKRPKDLTKINTNDLGELLWWSYYFGTTLEKLLAIVQESGNSIADVNKKISSVE